MKDGRIPLDTNLIERWLRPVAVGRKNFLFFGSQNGGRTAATLYSIVQSARRNNVDVLPYLTDVLRRLPAITSTGAPPDPAALDALLPNRWAAALAASFPSGTSHNTGRVPVPPSNSATSAMAPSAQGQVTGPT